MTTDGPGGGELYRRGLSYTDGLNAPKLHARHTVKKKRNSDLGGGENCTRYQKCCHLARSLIKFLKKMKAVGSMGEEGILKGK